ncbi:MAG: LacI family DNA-binding transcriptional regulator [Gammaproteobacteria bacterium]|nr:LacI family DNA-binding transcriptional regulator [Gammaproteobacteria bacterium]
MQVRARDSVPTINDVAAQAGVSKRTVSRVINNSDKVNEQTRLKVQAVIDELNYSPSSQARGLAAKRSFLLGLIYDVPTLFVNDVQKGLLSVCHDVGYDIVVHPCEIGSGRLIDDVRRFVNRSKVDGVIMLPPVSEIPELGEALDAIGVPNVRFSSEMSAEPWRLVVTNYVPAVTDMTNHLVKLGHRDIGFISGPRDHVSSQMRQQAFVHALARHGLELKDEFVAEGAFTYESGVEAARQLFAKDSRPTAIFAANDEMAFGVMNVADSMGISIPHDLSLVGFDGTKFATFVIPSLSTIRRPTTEMASLGARKLLAFINDGEDAARSFESMVSPQFVPRESTGPAPTDSES